MAFQPGSTEQCLQVMEEKLNQLEISPVNVAIIGNLATGKSSFINAIRRLDNDDEFAAPVGEFQSTLDIRDYLYPRVPGLKFWDLPGVGSKRFPKETYLKDICFEQYDFFILITAKRFTEIDAWLAQEIRKCQKGYFFVRTHIDEDISNDRMAHPNSHSEDGVIKTIHSYTVENLQACGSSDVQVFLVSNYDRTKYDFNKVEKELIEALPAIRRNAISVYKRSATRDMIQAASQSLRCRLWVYSAMSAAAAYVPNYFASAAVVAVLALNWSYVCFNHFGLGDKCLQRRARLTPVSSKTLAEIVSKNFEDRHKKMKRIAGIVIGILIVPASSLLFGLILKQYPPLLSRIISVSTSFASARLFFGHILQIPKKVATMIADASVSEITGEPGS